MKNFRAAVLGASGIGKNHAHWLHKHGCEIVAFLGSSPTSLAPTTENLRADFGFSGRGYHDLSELLQEAQPEIVCVSSPPIHHFAQVTQCLNAGAHVLCEKPFVFAENAAERQKQSEQLLDLARQQGVLLGTQMQYAVGVQAMREFCGHQEKVRHFTMEMETKNVKHNREGAEIWIDLSPHPLSILQVLAGPNDRIVPASLVCKVEKYQTQANFTLENSGISAEIIVRFDPDANPPLRRVAFDNCVVDLGGRKNDNGEFCAVLSTPDGREIVCPDFVDSLIANFLMAARGEAELEVTGAMGAQNVAWQWQILDAAHGKITTEDTENTEVFEQN